MKGYAMKKRMLGNGLPVSEIGLGCMGMDHAYGKPAPRKDMLALLHRSVELGCTFFDTALVYGTANEVPLEQFNALTSISIVIYYGDNIPKQPVSEPHQEYWRASLRMAKLWADAVNRHGGDVTVVHLPEAGLKGNTHFPFSDMNNDEVADLLSQWLKEKGLDQR